MTTLLLDWLQQQQTGCDDDVKLLDGGVSTHLEDMIRQGSEEVFVPRALWSSSLLLTREGQAHILQCHHDFLPHTDMLSTVTYQCHFGTYPDGKTRTRVISTDEQAKDMLHLGIQLAQEAAAAAAHHRRRRRRHYVVVSLGCYGAALADGSEYRGNYGVPQACLEEFHRLKRQALQDNNHYDALAFETVPCVEECRAIIEVCREPKNVCCWLSLACCNEGQLNDQTPLEEALDVIHQQDPHAQYIHGIGINCCAIQHTAPLLERLTRHNVIKANRQRRRGIVFYPNSGEEWDAVTCTWKTIHNEKEVSFATQIMHCIRVVENTWKEQCPSLPPPRIIVGGCCRTTPHDIATIRQLLLQRKRASLF